MLCSSQPHAGHRGHGFSSAYSRSNRPIGIALFGLDGTPNGPNLGYIWPTQPWSPRPDAVAETAMEKATSIEVTMTSARVETQTGFELQADASRGETLSSIPEANEMRDSPATAAPLAPPPPSRRQQPCAGCGVGQRGDRMPGLGPVSKQPIARSLTSTLNAIAEDVD